MGLVGVGLAVGPVGDADLDDALGVEAGVDQTAHRRTVAAALADVVVRVEGDQAGARQLVTRDADQDRAGDGVVTTDGDDEPRALCAGRSGRAGAPLPLLEVRVLDVTEVERRHAGVGIGQVDPTRGAHHVDSRASTRRTACGVACAPVGDSDVANAGTPRQRDMSTGLEPGPAASHSLARGQRASVVMRPDRSFGDMAGIVPDPRRSAIRAGRRRATRGRPPARGRGSVGRASPCQGEGRGFESRRPLGASCRAPVTRPAGWPSGLGKGLQSPVRGFDSRPGLVRSAQLPGG